MADRRRLAAINKARATGLTPIAPARSSVSSDLDIQVHPHCLGSVKLSIAAEPAGIICYGIDHCRQILAQHARNRLAGIAAFPCCDFVGVLFQFHRPIQNMAVRILLQGTFEGAAGGNNGMVQIGLVAFGEVAITCSVTGLRVLKERPRRRRHAVAVDQQQHWLGFVERQRLFGYNYMQKTSCIPHFYC